MQKRVNSLYIHIPFCKSICSYCDFCKVYYSKDLVKKYLRSLRNEVLKYYQGEIINTLYIGGGTPSVLSMEELDMLFSIIDLFKKDIKEFTFECNIESIDLEKLEYLRKKGVNRLSIGVESFNETHLKYLNRTHTKDMIIEKIKLCKRIFQNINVDLIYALENQTLSDLEDDLDNLIKLDIPHISTYSLIIEPHTVLYNKKVHNSSLDDEMYQLILKKLSHFHHYEVSNFAKEGYESIHNQTYWKNLEYYGFGAGASGYINNERYDNTRDIIKYINGKYRYQIHNLSFNETVENAFILGFRMIDGIDIKSFKDKYNLNILSIPIIKELLNKNELEIVNNKIRIVKSKIYLQNDILIHFLDVNYEIVKINLS